MRTSARKGIDLNLDHRMSHSFARLLVEAVGKTDWDMDLGLGGEDDEVDRRVVN